jgi:acyl carrier protein phosphodiesterase
MNFLAHALLAGSRPADRLGGILGDFVKGPLPAGLPPDVAAGVALHRRIDSYADRHPAFRRSRSRVSPARRRYAGIMVDLFYDHFLARHWERYHPQALANFAAEIYELLGAHAALLPPRLAQILPLMRGQDWLASYRWADQVAGALDRMAVRRFTRPNGLAGAGADLGAAYAGFEADFAEFFPDALGYAQAMRVELSARPSRP